MKSKITKWKSSTRQIIAAGFCLVVAVTGFLLLSFGSAALPEVDAGLARPGVPIPSQGAYFGGINKENIPSTYSVQTLPGCTDTSSQWKLLECKIAWAGREQGLTVPANYATNMEHFFTSCEGGDATFKPGGTIYKSSETPGRKVLFINMKCSDWGTLANGTGSAYQTAESNLRNKVRLLAALKTPVIFVYHHEPENDGGDPNEYRAAFRRVSGIVRSEQTNINNSTISVGLALMGCTFDGSAGDCPTYGPVDRWYPGDDAVDWIMSQPYNKLGCTNYKDDLSRCRTLDRIVDSFYNWANAPCPTTNIPTSNYNCTSARQSKPLALGEYGIGSNYDDVIVPKRIEFYERNRVAASTKYPRIKMWAYWSEQVSDKPYRYVVDWPVDANRTNLKGFARLALDSYFNNLTFSSTPPDPDPPIGLPIAITSPAAGITVKDVVTITTGPDTDVQEVSFRINDAWQFSDTAAPFSWDWDTTKVPNGQTAISIRARKNGDLGGVYTEKSITVNVQNSTTPPPQKQCDFNDDQLVDLTDLSKLLSNYGKMVAPNKDGDCTGDGRVELVDLSALLGRYGK